MRFVRAVVEGLRLALKRERLGPAPAPSALPRRKPTGVLHVLFVSREPLGVEPERPRAPRAVLRALFAPEPLPLDPPLPATRRRGRLAALFAPEKLDDSP